MDMKIRLLLGAAHLIACANPGCAGRAEQNGAGAATPPAVVQNAEARSETSGGQLHAANGADEPASTNGGAESAEAEPAPEVNEVPTSIDFEISLEEAQRASGEAPKEDDVAEDDVAEGTDEEQRGTRGANGRLPAEVAPVDVAEVTSNEASLIQPTDFSEAEATLGPGPLPMFGAVAIYKVKDFEAWRAEFDAQLEERQRAGFVAQGVMRGVDDGTTVAVWLAVTDVARAKAYFANKPLRARMNRAGVVGQPQVRLSSNVAARMEPGRTGLHAALVALRVEDFSRFVAAFREQAQARVLAGIVGYALGQDVTDPQRVYVQLQSENPQLLKKHLATPSVRKRWQDAGVRGSPVVTIVREDEVTLCR